MSSNPPELAAPTTDQTLSAPSLLRRMACWLYEGMLLFAVVFVAGWLFSTLSQSRHALDNRLGLQVFLFVVLGIYFTWFWAKGQTLAMKTWHISLVSKTGQPISQWRALRRYALSWIWFVPSLAVISMFKLSPAESVLMVMGWCTVWALLSRFQREKQFWHDVWAGTRLVTNPRPGD